LTKSKFVDKEVANNGSPYKPSSSNVKRMNKVRREHDEKEID
jgi:hypothetical protein